MSMIGRTGVRRSLLAVLTAAVLVAAAACGNSGGESSSANPPTSGTPSGTGQTTSSVDLSQKVSLADVPGVTDDEIRFTVTGTGAANPLGTCLLSCFDDGVRAYFDFRNSQGGVWGRQLVVSQTLDDELAKAQDVSLEIVSADDTFATFSAPLVPTGWPAIADAGIPLYTLAIHPTDGQPEIFGNSPAHCFDCTSRPFAYLVEQAEATKVGVIGYGVSENSKLCAESNRSTVERYSDDIGGAEVVYYNDGLPFGLANGVGPEVTAMKDAGVEFVLSCLDLNGMKTLAAEMQRQGIRDQVTMVHANSYDQEYVASSDGLFDGDIVLATFRPFEADAGDSQLADFQEWIAKRGAQPSEHAMIGWINADLAYQGLVAAGPELSREKVIAATNGLTAFTAGGLVPPIDWSRQHLPPTEDDIATHGSEPECFAAVRVVGTHFEVEGDAAKPWFCWPGDTRDWSEPTSQTFG